MCTKQIDSFGKECLTEDKYLYKYRGEIGIPPLGMVDDVLCVSECGYPTAMINSYINHKMGTKKLQFGISKCKKIHVGRSMEDHKCRDLKVDEWKVEQIQNVTIGTNNMDEKFLGPQNIEKVDMEKYLGDILSQDSSNVHNIKNRQKKGIVASRKIISILQEIYFGKYYFDMAVTLRNSLLISTLLFNSESWYNVTNANIKVLEQKDERFIRHILNASSSTPKNIL